MRNGRTESFWRISSLSVSSPQSLLVLSSEATWHRVKGTPADQGTHSIRCVWTVMVRGTDQVLCGAYSGFHQYEQDIRSASGEYGQGLEARDRRQCGGCDPDRVSPVKIKGRRGSQTGDACAPSIRGLYNSNSPASLDFIGETVFISCFAVACCSLATIPRSC